MMGRLHLLLLILLLFCTSRILANGSSGPKSKSNLCQKVVYQHFETSTCMLCLLNAFLSRCPSGTEQVTTGMGLRKCILSSNAYGCVHICKRKVVQSVCCRDYWGLDCQPCPGLPSGQPACFGNGKCYDLENGNGTCKCNASFEGFACELCSNKRKYGSKCATDCKCKNGECDSGVLGNGTCSPFTCKRGYYGENCNTFEKNCSSCGNNSHCDPKSKSCQCNPGYSGDGKHCAEVNACEASKKLCPSPNTVCHKTGPGLHKCICRDGYRGDGVICAAIDPCQTSNGNCPNNAQCNYLGPGKANCTCLPGYVNYNSTTGCSIMNECTVDDCPSLNAECVMASPGKKECRCKNGYVGNGTVCNGNILQRINDLHDSASFTFGHIKNVIKKHSDLTFTFSDRGPYTMFLPTDEGLEKAFTKKQLRYIITDKRMVLDLILVHSTQAYLPTSLLNMSGNLTTLKGWDAHVTNNGGLFYQLNNHSEEPKIISSDNIAWNGILHVIDAPAWKPDFKNYLNTTLKTVWQVIGERPELKTFLDLIQVAGMIDQLKTISSNDVTVIAPVNEAFASLHKNDTEFLKSPKGKAKLQAIIRHHIFQFKIGIIDLSFQNRIMSLAPEFVSVGVKAKGAVLLGNKSKLVENNIPASNAYLHFTDNLLIPSFVLPIIQRHCDYRTARVKYSPCQPCGVKYSNGNCPRNYISTDQTFRCRYWFSFIPGCRTLCLLEVQSCCEGFYGSDCSPCPGPVGNACYGNGQCADGVQGNGTCRCNPDFKGTACELCKDYQKFGSGCNKSCRCVHGTCDNGRFGSGSCIPNSCKTGYRGQDCAIRMMSCSDATKIPCHINGRCYLNGSQAICVCQNGYEKAGENCYEIDPCLREDRGGCDKNAICKKTAPGRSSCTCSPGWTGDGTLCTPINYCTLPGRCHKNAKCTFLGPGQFNCECKFGYDGDGTSCREINSCLKDNGKCSSLARCIKTGPGRNKCKCYVGYLGDGYTCLQSLAQVVKERKELTIMSAYMVKYNLIRYLANPENMTAFIPSDSAISKLDNKTRKLLDVPANLFYFGGSNVVPALYDSSKLRNKSINMLPTLYIDFKMTINHSESGEPLIGGIAKIVIPNISASNGILHIVDKVVFPPFMKNPRVGSNASRDFCASANNFTELCQLIRKFNLEVNVSHCNPCTIIAPTDEALKKMRHTDFYNLTASDILYHMTNHFISPRTILHFQPFTSLAGDDYRLLFERNGTEVTVNGQSVSFVEHNSTWIIYKMNHVFKAVKNTCYKRLNLVLKPRSCRPCRFVSRLCRPGFRYAGTEDCIYSAYGSAFIGCKPVCVKPIKFPLCCDGFWGPRCFACPGENNNPCFGNGVCDDETKGTGHCKCDPNFTGTACERCISGHFGPKCDQKCDCHGNGPCDRKTGFCICPRDKKGVKCNEIAKFESCTSSKNGSPTSVKCHQHARCYNNNTENGSCKCDYGFTGNGRKCESSLCKSCSKNAECGIIPSNGTLTCTCKDNYKGDGYYCQGLNLCVEQNASNCLGYADCFYVSPGRFACKCKAGFTGDGSKSCKRINPCAVNNGGCSIYANCYFNESTFNTTCNCSEGFLGDGKNCVGNVLQRIQNDPNLQEFHSRLIKSSIKAVLSPENHVSIIAPQNAAFTHSRRKRRSAEVLSDIDLRHYVVSCVSLYENDVKIPGQTFVTVAGSQWNITSSMVINRDVKILSVNTNGTSAILTVDKLLVLDSQQDSSQNMSLIVAAHSKGYGKFVQLLTNASYLDVVSNIYHRPYTMFWPNDEAFAGLPVDIKAKLSSDKSYARNIINYHVVQASKITTNDILSYSGGLSRRTREGSPLYISCSVGGQFLSQQKGDLFINDRSKIIERDIKFKEGVAFGVSKVLLPPGVAGRCDEIKFVNIDGFCTACGGYGFCPPGATLESVDQNSTCVYQGQHLGCLSRCIKRTKVTKCCKNFYGTDCLECPGGFGKPCNGNGVCAQGISGNGTCSCEKPFLGTSCEYCRSDSSDCHKFIRKICTSRKNPCSIFATCNAGRGHLCQCWKGYEGDGYYCREIDKCQTNNGGCNMNAICIYTGPNTSSCECRSGYVGDGYHCTALSPLHPCAINQGNCHEHAQCIAQDSSAVCRCREGFVGDGRSCTGTALSVIYTVEKLSEFAKQIKNLERGVEGHRISRYLSSEKEYTVFAPINSGLTKTMNINDLKNHIVEGNLSLTKTQIVFSLAKNKITVEVSVKNPIRLNKMARVLFTYPATNGMVAVIDGTLPYKKPPDVKPKPTKPAHTATHPTSGKQSSNHPTSGKQSSNNTGKIIGATVGVTVPIIIIIVALCFIKRQRSPSKVKYNRNFENMLLESEEYTEDDRVDDDEYQHQTLQHPSTEVEATTVANPTYVGNDVDVQDDLLEMTEVSSIVPLTQHDAISLIK